MGLTGFDFRTICILIIIFFIFAVIGWLMEVMLKYIQYGRFINRGFFIGPYCPIYGFGVVVIIVIVGSIIGKEGTYGGIFLTGVIVCGIFEYFVSFYMEKAFHARWWDYSGKPLNLNGRIWIGNLILFGLGSIIIVEWVAPVLLRVLYRWPVLLIEVMAISIGIIFLADYIASHFLMNIVKQEIDKCEADNTEEISLKVHELLKEKSAFVRRIHEAYPNLQARPKWLTNQLKKSKSEFKRIKKMTQEEIKKAMKSTSADKDKYIAAAKLKQKQAKKKLDNIKKRLTFKKYQ